MGYPSESISLLLGELPYRVRLVSVWFCVRLQSALAHRGGFIVVPKHPPRAGKARGQLIHTGEFWNPTPNQPGKRHKPRRNHLNKTTRTSTPSNRPATRVTRPTQTHHAKPSRIGTQQKPMGIGPNRLVGRYKNQSLGPPTNQLGERGEKSKNESTDESKNHQ